MDDEVEPRPAPASSPVSSPVSASVSSSGAVGVDWGPPAGPAVGPPSLHDRSSRRRLVAGGAIAASVAVVVGSAVFALLAIADQRDDVDTIAASDVSTSQPVSDTTSTSMPFSPVRPSATSTSTSTAAATTTIDGSAPAGPLGTVVDGSEGDTIVTAPPVDDDAPAVVARPIPTEEPPPPPDAPPPEWAASQFVTDAGYVSTDVGCAADDSPETLDAFFAAQVGPVLGWDYQHVYDLGDGRNLWLFQDTFIDQSGTATTLGGSRFVHNAALVQTGSCFRLLHRGTSERPQAFEPGTGTATLTRWFWPMGGEVHDGRLHVFWAEMVKDAVDPAPPDGLGWHPVATHIGVYDPVTLARVDFRPAPNSGATPIYGYAVSSDDTHTYLFGNTFEQNMTREGGWFNGPHSATLMFLARVPRGQMFAAPEYWRPEGWDPDPAGAQPFLRRHWAEFPMQPRYLGGQWVATTAVNGYWGEEFEVDVALQPWGPWTTVESRALLPRGFDRTMNTYHAHLMPRLATNGDLVVTVSNNARDMLRDAWPAPHRYRPVVFRSLFQLPPAPTTTTTTTTTTAPPATTVATTTTTTTTTTVPPPATTTTTTTTAVPPTTTTSTSTSTSTSTTTTAPATTTSTSSTSTSTTSTSTTSTVAPSTVATSTTPEREN